MFETVNNVGVDQREAMMCDTCEIKDTCTVCDVVGDVKPAQ